MHIPQCVKTFRNWGLLWFRNGNSTLNAESDAWFTEWGDVFMNCMGCEAVRIVIDCIMSNKFWKWVSFHLPTRLNVFWLCKFFLSDVQTETFYTWFFVQFCILTSASYSTSCYLFLKKYLIFFGGLGYIVFIHKRFCCAQLQVFPHIWEKYFSCRENLVVPNLWPSVYIYFIIIIIIPALIYISHARVLLDNFYYIFMLMYHIFIVLLEFCRN